MKGRVRLKHTFKNSAKAFGIKLAVSFIFIAFMLSFTWLFKFSLGYMLYSTVTSIILLSWLFSVFKSEGKKLGAQNKSPYLGFLYGGICECISLVILIAMLIFKNSFKVFNTIYWVFNATFTGFFKPDAKLFQMTGISPLYVLPLFVVPIICGIGYYLGYKKIEFSGNFLNKLVYKDEEGGTDEKEK